MRIPTALTLVLGFLALSLAACGGDSADGPGPATTAPDGAAEATDPGDPGEVFRRYRAAMRDGDFEALKRCMSAAALEEMKDADEQMVLSLLRSFLPEEEEVVGVEVSDDGATIRLTAEQGGQTARGTVTLVREAGAFKVAKESWRHGDGGFPEPEVVAKPAPPPPPADWKPDGEWRLDCHEREIPDRPALGRANGKTFQVSFARLQNGILTLTDGDLFDWNAQFIIFLFLGEGEVPAGRTFAFGPKQDFSGPTCHVHFHRLVGENDRKVDSKVDGFSLRLEFGKRKGDELPGKLYLCYPDDEKSYVAGSFTAKVE